MDARRGTEENRQFLPQGDFARRVNGDRDRLALGTDRALARPGGERRNGAISVVVHALDKRAQKAWVEPLVDPESRDGWRFEVRSGPLTKRLEAELAKGTKSARATFNCVLTGASLTGAYIDSEARAGRMSARLMAIVAEGDRARTYLSPSTQHEDAAASAAQWVEEHEQDLDLPDQQCRGTFASNALGRRYCFETYKDYFTKRQQLALATFSELASTIRDVVDNDCANAGLNVSGDPLHAGGIGAQAYADAIATYLAIIVGRCTDAWSSVTSWASTGEFIRKYIRASGHHNDVGLLGV